MEKFAVVGEIFPPDDMDRLCVCLMRVDKGTTDVEGEIDLDENAAERSGMTPSSDINIVMLLGGLGNTDDVVLNRLRCVLDGGSNAEVAKRLGASWCSGLATSARGEGGGFDFGNCRYDSRCRSSFVEFALDLDSSEHAPGIN
jgi:hypothetical protein